MASRLTILLTFLSISFHLANCYTLSKFEEQEEQKLALGRWTTSALNIIYSLACSDFLIATDEDCVSVALTPPEQMNLYFADPSPEGQLIAMLPDGRLDRNGHDGVMVLDPFPSANYGHLLIVFFVDTDWTEEQCTYDGGFYVGMNECLSPGYREQCRNKAARKIENGTKLSREEIIKRCEINFFPMVHLVEDNFQNVDQRLTCRNGEGFKSCPNQRYEILTGSQCFPDGEGYTLNKHAFRSNCKKSARCDHAVLISGSWNQFAETAQYLANVIGMQIMLTKYGFLEENIKMFYSNGCHMLEAMKYRLYPAYFKQLMRSHIRKVCRSQRCADSLVIYLNSPSDYEGTSMLWDKNSNGKVDLHDEQYSLTELLYDTSNCNARQVYMIADQSYSEKLIQRLRESSSHGNVLAFTSGQQHEYSKNGEYTKLWAQFNHTGKCMSEVHEAIKLNMESSIPVSFDPSYGSINKTIYGGPCGANFKSLELFAC